MGARYCSGVNVNNPAQEALTPRCWSVPKPRKAGPKVKKFKRTFKARVKG